MLAFADPPRHTKQRRLLVSAFSPARVEAIGPHIQSMADDAIDQLPIDGGTFELTSAIGAALPVQIICEMLGVPMADRDDFRRWSEVSQRAASLSDRSSVQADLDAFSAYLAGRVADRQAALDAGDRPDDLITAIMTAEVDGDRFTPTECAAIIRLLLSPGNTTTTTLIGNLVKAIEEHPVEKAKLLSDLDGVPIAQGCRVLLPRLQPRPHRGTGHDRDALRAAAEPPHRRGLRAPAVPRRDLPDLPRAAAGVRRPRRSPVVVNPAVAPSAEQPSTDFGRPLAR